MTSAIPMIRVAGPDDLDAVAALLTEAFLPDPIMSAITAAAPDPQRALTHLHHVKLASHYLSTDETARAGARVDLAVDASDRLLGAALWDAPVTGSGPSGVAGPLKPDRAAPPGLDPDILGRARDLCLLDDALCKAHRPASAHWYLSMIAVVPLARGTGTGSTLLRRGLDRVDADGVAAHLESTAPGSRPLYERLGFKRVAVLDAPPLPAYWAMTRPAPGSR